MSGEAGPREYSLAPAPVRVHITPRAREALEEVLRLRPRGSVVHLVIAAGPPAYPSLAFRPASAGQLVFEEAGVPLVVDPSARPYFEGATLDHVVRDGFGSFEIDGPHLPPRAEGGEDR